MNPVEVAARGYLAAGLSVIPIRTDGSKAPAESGWREYSDRRATGAEVVAWWGTGARHRYGVGITGGAASGNLAVFDFETWDAYERWLKALPGDAQKRTRACPLARSGGGGAHLYVRLSDTVPGAVLARHLVNGAAKTLIEVRADGQQVVAPGSPSNCHPSGNLYEWLRESWTVEGTTYAEVPVEEYLQWCFVAESLNKVEEPAREPVPVNPQPRARPDGDVRPGDDFSRRGTWAETGLFDLAGWEWHREVDYDRGFVRRPGKARGDGLSGTVGMVTSTRDGWPLFHCFTSNGAPFEAGASYSRFRVYTILKHKGDYRAAAGELGRMGYGSAAYGRAANAVTIGSGNTPSADAARAATVDPDGNRAEPAKRSTLPLVYYDEITPSLAAADFVEGVLTDGAMSVIYGDSNTGKTFFVLDLALHVAAARPWRGRAVDARGVLYLALEGSHGIRNRVCAFKLDQLVNAVELPFAVVPVALDLLNPGGDTIRVIDAAKAAAQRLTVPVGLIVVDTLSRAIAGGNENASEDMGALVRHLDLIRQALPAHVAVVHHSGKDAARGARGHSLLRAATDTEIEVSRDHGAKRSTARVTKQREMELGDEFPFTLAPITLGTNRRGKPVVSCVVRHEDTPTEGIKKERTDARALEKLNRERSAMQADEEAVRLVIAAEAARGYPGASKTFIGDQASCGYRRALAALDRMIDRGEVVQREPFDRVNGNQSKTRIKEPFGFADTGKTGED